jgi:dUTP pyrophosphatase
MEIKIKKIHPNAVIPSRATIGSAGYDLVVPESIVINSGRNVVPLGFALELPENVGAVVRPRSGNSSKGLPGSEMVCLPTGDFISLQESRFDADVLFGLIDSDYRGNIGVIINNYSCDCFMLKAGTAVAQMTFQFFETPLLVEAEELSETERADGGFGHTDINAQ